jgi:hypothetical protein
MHYGDAKKSGETDERLYLLNAWRQRKAFPELDESVKSVIMKGYALTKMNVPLLSTLALTLVAPVMAATTNGPTPGEWRYSVLSIRRSFQSATGKTGPHRPQA